MKKDVILFIALSVISSIAIGQIDISKGVKIGLNFATVNSNNPPPSLSSVTQFAVGGFIELKLPVGISLEPELLFNAKGFSWQDITTANGNSANVSYTQTLWYVDIPIVVKYYLPVPLMKVNCYVGPTFGFLLSAKSKVETKGITNEVDIKNHFTSSDYGLVFGAGIAFPFVLFDATVDARYNLGLSNVSSFAETEVHNRVFTVLVGLSF